jgi:hypothetical protein
MPKEASRVSLQGGGEKIPIGFDLEIDSMSMPVTRIRFCSSVKDRQSL